MIPLLKENNIQILGIKSYLSTETDYNTLIFKVANAHPDSILLFSHAETSTTMVTKIKKLFPKLKIQGPFDEIQPNNFSLIENIPYISMKNIDPEFDKRFEDKFGEHIFARAAHAYDLTKLIKDYTTTIPADVNLNKEELITYLNNVKNYKGVSGNLNSNGKRTIEGDCLWKVVKKSGDSYVVQAYKQ
jgi:ABC-type branched-subunit amino acid transport system substrate-binding protein